MIILAGTDGLLQIPRRFYLQYSGEFGRFSWIWSCHLNGDAYDGFSAPRLDQDDSNVRAAQLHEDASRHA